MTCSTSLICTMGDLWNVNKFYSILFYNPVSEMDCTTYLHGRFPKKTSLQIFVTVESAGILLLLINYWYWMV
jgi:hypothetical protein